MTSNREATPAGRTLYDPDLHLVHAAREGNTSAFEELVRDGSQAIPRRFSADQLLTSAVFYCL
jgi:hypothetical protein